jgi:hypothetical protein
MATAHLQLLKRLEQERETLRTKLRTLRYGRRKTNVALLWDAHKRLTGKTVGKDVEWGSFYALALIGLKNDENRLVKDIRHKNVEIANVRRFIRLLTEES